MTIKYVEHPETATYTWDMAGGCFEDVGYGTYTKYVPVEVGETHDFNKVFIEVRQIPSDDIVEEGSTGSSGKSSSGVASVMWFISFISTILFLASLGALAFKYKVE